MPKAKAPKRKRMKFDFRLEYKRASDVMLMEQIDILKRHHEFLGVIRDGIRLVCDLRAGRADVLLELFPSIVQHIQADAALQFETIIQRLDALDAQQGRALPAVARAPRLPARTGGIVVAEGGKASAQTVAANFVSSMAGLAAGFFD